MARLGGPIACIIAGLVLALAVTDRLSGVDLTMVGWILTGAGALWLVLSLLTARPGGTVTRETTNVAGPAGTDRLVDREVRHDVQ